MCVYIQTYAHEQLNTHICMCIYMHTRAHEWLNTHMYVYTHMYVCIHTHAHELLSTHMYVYIHTCTQATKHTCVYPYMHTYTCIYVIHVCVLSHFSHVLLFATPWTVDCQAPLSLGILQARLREWVAMPSCRGPSQPRGWTRVSGISRFGRLVFYH